MPKQHIIARKVQPQNNFAKQTAEQNPSKPFKIAIFKKGRLTFLVCQPTLALQQARKCRKERDRTETQSLPLETNNPPYLQGFDEWWWGKDSNLGRRKPADLQSALVDRLSIPPQAIGSSISKLSVVRQLGGGRKFTARTLRVPAQAPADASPSPTDRNCSRPETSSRTPAP